jgi:hypothetical protein
MDDLLSDVGIRRGHRSASAPSSMALLSPGESSRRAGRFKRRVPRVRNYSTGLVNGNEEEATPWQASF